MLKTFLVKGWTMSGHPLDVGGLPIPDERPMFLAVLGVHVAAGQ